jgi:hypothetical protein
MEVMNQAFIELLEAAKAVVTSANIDPKLSAGDMCVDGRKVQSLGLAVQKAENVHHATDTPSEQQLAGCQNWLWAHGRAYPRTCTTCGLFGTCRYNQPQIRAGK